jgi:hypothetical protein
MSLLRESKSVQYNILLGLLCTIPSPSTGEGEGGGEGRWSAYAVLLPPIPTFPREGGRGKKPLWHSVRVWAHCAAMSSSVS